MSSTSTVTASGVALLLLGGQQHAAAAADVVKFSPGVHPSVKAQVQDEANGGGSNQTAIHGLVLDQVFGPVSPTDGRHFFAYKTQVGARPPASMTQPGAAKTACATIRVLGEAGRLAEAQYIIQANAYDINSFSVMDLTSRFFLGASAQISTGGPEWSWDSQPDISFVEGGKPSPYVFATPFTNPSFSKASTKSGLMMSFSETGAQSWTAVDPESTSISSSINRVVCQVNLKPELYQINRPRPTSGSNMKRFFLFAFRDGEAGKQKYNADRSLAKSVCSAVTQGNLTAEKPMILSADENSRMTFELGTAKVNSSLLSGAYPYKSGNNWNWFWDNGANFFGGGSSGTYQAPADAYGSLDLYKYNINDVFVIFRQQANAHHAQWFGLHKTDAKKEGAVLTCELTLPASAPVQLVPQFTSAPNN